MEPTTTGAAPAATPAPTTTAAPSTTPTAVSNPTPAATSTPEQSTPTATSTPASANDTVIASGGKGDGGLVLVKDPATGKRTVRRASQMPEQEPPAQAEQAPVAEQIGDATPTSDQALNAAQTVNAVPEKYNLSEFSAAIAAGEVDESRVPEEYSKQYADFKIQQAMQAYNERQKQAEAQKQEVEKQLSPEEAAQARRDFYTKLNDGAKERALKDMGITTEQLEQLELEDDDAGLMAYRAAYDWHRQQLINEVQQRVQEESAAKQAQQNIYRGIIEFVNDAKAKEPNFNAIDQIMQTRYKTLPYEKGRAAEEAIKALQAGNITESQAVVLREYYEDVRKEYYAEKNGLSTTPQVAKPPVVETAGNGYQLPRETAPDYSALRNAGSLKERRAWLQNFFAGNRTR